MPNGRLDRRPPWAGGRVSVAAGSFILPRSPGEGRAGGPRVVGASFFLLLAACAHVGPTPDEALRAGQEAQASSTALGIAALVELDRGQAGAAQALLKRAPDSEESTPLLA